MKRKIFIIILLISSVPVCSQGLKTEGKKIINQSGNEVILRGIGVGGWMLMEGYMMHSSDVADTQHEFRDRLVELMGESNTDDFFDAWLANHVTKQDIDSLASWGFNSIRLPMHYNLFTLPIEDEPVTGENTWLDKGFNMVDSLLQWCETNQIYLILDLHAAPGGQGANAAICDYDPSKPSLWESQQNKDKTVALWGKLAERYNDKPWIGGYDLLNEVNWTLPGNAALKSLYIEITNTIRAVDTNHIIFIEGNSYANDFTGLTPPWDDNMAYSFHKYWSYNDQGSIQWVLNIREQHNVPLWMGEGGENSNVWFHDAISLFEVNNIGWSWWPMKRIETIVSPYSILFTDGYKSVLNYWRNQGPKPSVSEAFDAMMELALNTNSSNCLYRKDVHDTQIRTINTDETIPFSDHSIPGIVYLSDYDMGTLNHSYYDTDYVNYSMATGQFQAWNSGWVYRNDGVDIETNNDEINSNGFHIAFIAKGEWINYTVQINEAGAYTAKVRVASQQSGGEFHLSLDNEDVTTTTVSGSTGSWTNFTDLEIPDILLTEGQHVLKLEFDNSTPFNVSSIEFNKTGDIDSIPLNAINGQTGPNEKSIEVYLNHPILYESLEGSLNKFSLVVNGNIMPLLSFVSNELKERTIIFETGEYLLYTDIIKLSYDGEQIVSTSGKTLDTFTDLTIRNTLRRRFALPRKIQAEDFDYMEGLGIEDCSDVGGGKNIGYTNPGDFADYRIFTNSENTYEVNIRVAAQNSTGKVGFYLVDEDDNETELGTIITPKTGGWQTWTNITANLTAPIPKGINTLRMKPLSGEINMNWYQFDILNSINDDDDLANSGTVAYPNPVRNNQLYIDIDKSVNSEILLEIYSITGKHILTEPCKPNNGLIEIDISIVPRGVFILNIATEEYIYNHKIIKQ